MPQKTSQGLCDILSALPLESNFISAIIGALVGAVAGGIIAYLVQAMALKEARKQRAEDHLSVQQALGRSMLIKVSGIYSHSFRIHEFIEEAFQEVNKVGGEPWQYYNPVVNVPEPINFTSDELGMLLGLKADNVFNSVLAMDVNLNGLLRSIEHLNSLKMALRDKLKVSQVEGKSVSSHLSKEEFFALRPVMIDFNTLAESIRASSQRYYKEARVSLDGLTSVLKEKLSIKHRMEFFEDTTEQATKPAPQAGTAKSLDS